MDNRRWLHFELAHLQADFATIPNLNILAERIGRHRSELVAKAEELGIVRTYVAPAPRTTRQRPQPRMTASTNDTTPRPTRRDGEQLVVQYRDKDLNHVSQKELKHIIRLLSRLHKDDFGLWEELILNKAKAALAAKQFLSLQKQAA